MKRCLRLIFMVLAMGIFIHADIFASNSEIFEVKVSVVAEVGVELSGGPIDFGTMGVGQSIVSPNYILVKNNGSGSKQTYSLASINPVGWTAVTGNLGMNNYRLNAAFDLDGKIDWSIEDHVLTTTPVASSVKKFAGDQTGESVPYDEDRKLFLKLETPPKTTEAGAKTIQVMITASVE